MQDDLNEAMHTDRMSNDEAAAAIMRGDTAPWVQWCRDRGVDPREVFRLMLAQGTTTVTDVHGIRVTTIDFMPDDTLLLVSDDGDIVGGVTDIGKPDAP